MAELSVTWNSIEDKNGSELFNTVEAFQIFVGESVSAGRLEYGSTVCPWRFVNAREVDEEFMFRFTPLLLRSISRGSNGFECRSVSVLLRESYSSIRRGVAASAKSAEPTAAIKSSVVISDCLVRSTALSCELDR
jgi:hypothetical protein